MTAAIVFEFREKPTSFSLVVRSVAAGRNQLFGFDRPPSSGRNSRVGISKRLVTCSYGLGCHGREFISDRRDAQIGCQVKATQQ